MNYEIDKAQSQSSGKVGRSRTSAHGFTLTLDASRRPQPDGLTNSEAFLGSVSSCGVTMIETHAEESGIALVKTEVWIEGLREPGIHRYAEVRMNFVLTGVTAAQADLLLAYWRNHCPLYGTLAHAIEVKVECTVA